MQKKKDYLQMDSHHQLRYIELNEHRIKGHAAEDQVVDYKVGLN